MQRLRRMGLMFGRNRVLTQTLHCSAIFSHPPGANWAEFLSARLYSPAKALPNQVRRLYKKRSAITSEAGHNLSREWIRLVQIHVVVVANIKRCAGARRPSGEQLGTHPGAKGVVVDDRAGKRGPGKLVSAPVR